MENARNIISSLSEIGFWNSKIAKSVAYIALPDFITHFNLGTLIIDLIFILRERTTPSSTHTSKGRAQSCLFGKYISQIVLGLLWNWHKYFAFVSALTKYSQHTVTALISPMFISSITNAFYVVFNWLSKSFLLLVFYNEF